jgi:toxin ParE1/3/4
MAHTVFLLEDAVQDLESIYRYIKSSGNKIAAKEMIFAIRKACDNLSENPERGHIPNELSMAGRFEYRQIIAKKYRIIYQVADSNVFVFGIIHGNRNIGEVLRQRFGTRN